MGLLKYDYSTKNFHRFSKTVPNEPVNEVYVARAHMPQPVAEVQVDVVWHATQPVVAEKVKPAKS